MKRATRSLIVTGVLLLISVGVTLAIPIYVVRPDMVQQQMSRYPVIPPAVVAAADTSSNTPASRTARYLAQRHAAVDRLLPQGIGGTHFYEQLDSAAGVSYPAIATIGIVVRPPFEGSTEGIELHERAHLMHAHLQRETDAVLGTLAAPASDGYAARSRNEHVGEMAVEAWELLVPPRGLEFVDSPVQRLRDAELRVPGTSGFVLYYLRDTAFAELDGRAELQALAEAYVRSHRAQWDALWAAIEHRRRADGTLEPWPMLSTRESLALMRRRAADSDSMMQRLTALLMLPSLGVAWVLRL